MADIFELLRHEHEQVQHIFSQMLKTSDSALKRRSQLLDKLANELLPHMYAEEGFFYEFLLDKLKKKEKESVFEGFEEHRAARFVFSDLEGIPVGDPRWHAQANVLSELVEHHIEEEESVIFELARGVIDASAAQSMAKEFIEKKKQQPVEIRL